MAQTQVPSIWHDWRGCVLLLCNHYFTEVDSVPSLTSSSLFSLAREFFGTTLIGLTASLLYSLTRLFSSGTSAALQTESVISP